MSHLSICVFCGARPGTNPAYIQAAKETGEMIARNGWRLVYGAGDVGIMGEVSRAASQNSAKTLGVIPDHLISHEKGNRDLDQFIVTENMHERKKVMYMNSDAIVVLPGGAGSLDEFFEVLTWRQLGLHSKPIFLVDIEGYWAPLITLLEHIVDQGFADKTVHDYVNRVTDIPTLETKLQNI